MEQVEKRVAYGVNYRTVPIIERSRGLRGLRKYTAENGDIQTFHAGQFISLSRRFLRIKTHPVRRFYISLST